MKKVLLSLAIVAAAFGANAQSEDASKLKFSVGVEAAAPFGDFADGYSFGIGGSAQADYWVAPEFALTLNAGYISFQGKTVTTPSYTIFGFTIPGTSYKNPSVGFIPVLAGGKYNFTSQLYGSAQLGVTFSDQKGSGSIFTYAPGIGYKFTDNLDAVVKYTGYSQKGGTLSSAGIRVAYTF
jgi:hypothetical protein